MKAGEWIAQYAGSEPPKDANVEQIVGMGFTEAQARAALDGKGNDLARALNVYYMTRDRTV